MDHLEIMALFQDLNDKGITSVMVTYEPDIACFAKPSILFRDGKIVAKNKLRIAKI